MEQIETQATDLRYLTQTVALSQPPSASNHSSGGGGGSAGGPGHAQAQPTQAHSPAAIHAHAPAHSHAHHPHPHPHTQHARTHPSPLPLPHTSYSPTAPYARVSGDDPYRHPTMSPSLTTARPPPPPLLHAVSGGSASSPLADGPGPGPGPPPGASTPLPSPFSPDISHSHPYGGRAATSNGRVSPASHAGSVTPSAKRKPDDDEPGPKQQRSKRNRYISIACNECKRRKIKCNGETPCQRCGNLNLACLYSPNCCSNSFKDSDEYKHMSDKMHRIEEQVEALVQSVNALHQENQRLAPLQDRILPVPSSTVSPSPSSSIPSIPRPELAAVAARAPPAFRGGPTSIAFTVDVAKNTLHNMGYSGEPQEDSGAPAADASPQASPMLPSSRPPPSFSSLALRHHPPPPPTPTPTTDPFWEFDKNEMIRLCRLHEDEVGIMYPVVKIETVIEHAQNLTFWMESARKNAYVPPGQYDDTMADIRTLTLKIIMCCALAVEEHGHSDKAIRLYDSMQVFINAKLMGEPSSLATLPLLALVAGYRFLSNDEVLAWRVMGQVARHCLELGLHRREGIAKISDEGERRNGVNTFWTAYVLDRRWSFGTGLPYVLHDDKIDPNLPLPTEFPYLVAMITYSRLGAKIWSVVDFFEPAIIRDLKRDEFEQLDREIMQWYDSCPDAVKINNLDQELPLPSTPSYNLQRLQIWTRLRLNQIRIWLYTPILHSASSINDNMAQAQKVVDLARDTIHYLHRLNNSSNLYRRIQVFYHQFLTSAIVVLFLASTHQPVQFSANCRDEFYMAMNLVKDMSAKSWVSQRLWRTIRSLKAYAPRLGLQQQDDERPHQPHQPHQPPPVSQHPSYAAAVRLSTFSRLNQADSSSSSGSGSSSSKSYGAPAGGTGGSGGNGGTDSTTYYATPSASSFANPPTQHTPVQEVGRGEVGSGDESARPSAYGGHNADGASRPPYTTSETTATMATATATGAVPAAGGTASSSPGEEMPNGMQIQTEMTRIFEGYMGSIGSGGSGGADEDQHMGTSADGGTSGSYQGSDGLSADSLPHGEAMYEQFKSLF